MNFALKYTKRLAAALVACLLCGALVAHAEGFSEYDVKAAFLYNFGKFVEWPSNAFAGSDAPLVIGIYGDNPFNGHLADIVRGRSINGHPVVVRPLSDNELDQCQILFISASEQKSISTILKKLGNSSVLTVTENLDPFKSGVMINFLIQNKQIRFEINDAVAERAGLKISSKLLILAVRTNMSRGSGDTQEFLCARSP
jgi:hypothetical protein